MEDVELFPVPVIELPVPVEPNGSEALVLLLEDQGLERLCEVLSTDAVVSLFCRGFKVLFGGGKPLPVLLLIFGVELLPVPVVLLRKSANASLLVLERVTGTALKGSCFCWLVLLVIASDFQAVDEPKGSVGCTTSGGSAAAGRWPNGSPAGGKAIGLDLARLLAEKGSKESSKLLLTGTT